MLSGICAGEKRVLCCPLSLPHSYLPVTVVVSLKKKKKAQTPKLYAMISISLGGLV